MNPQAQVLSPQPQAGTPIQPQAQTVSPQGVASQVPVQAPTPPQLPQGQTPVATPAPVATPNFNTSQQLQNIAAYYQIPRTSEAVTGAGQAQGQVAQQQFEAQKAENTIKIQNQQNSLDPSKYQFVKNKDGSVTILNSVGDTVNIGQYAALTGANPAQALQNAGATDAASQQFIQAYNNMQTFVQDKIAAANGDTQAGAELDDFYKNNPGLQGLELGQLQTAFMQNYGSYFGQPEQGGGLAAVGASPTITSANNPLTTSPYENLNLYGNEEAENPYAVGFGNPSATYEGASPGSVSSVLSANTSALGVGNNNNGL